MYSHFVRRSNKNRVYRLNLWKPISTFKLALVSDYSPFSAPNYIELTKNQSQIGVRQVFLSPDENNREVLFSFSDPNYTRNFKRSLNKFLQDAVNETKTNPNLEPSGDWKARLRPKEAAVEAPWLDITYGNAGNMSFYIWNGEQVNFDQREHIYSLEFIRSINNFLITAAKEVSLNPRLKRFNKTHGLPVFE